MQIAAGVKSDFWTHEDASIMMFHNILETHPNLRQLITIEEEKLICDLIVDNKIMGREWISEIVSNSRNGIDVDKFDYLNRDTQKINVGYNAFNHDRVMRGARVINNQICYPEKEIYEIKKLYDSRYNLYKDCYYHRVTQAYECLILDILKAGHSIFDFMSAIKDPVLFIDLDDTIIHDIRVSTSKELEHARNLLLRFDSRKHYSFVGEKVLNKLINVSEKDVCQYVRSFE
jgi:HD superfamily phosphohydrolase